MGIMRPGIVPMGDNSIHVQIGVENIHTTNSDHASILFAGQKPKNVSEKERAPI
jgi:hypothetical protein